MGNQGKQGGPSTPVHAVEALPVTTLAGDSVDVFIQDQDTPPFQYYLMNEIKDDITLTADISVDDNVISVSAGHGFTAAGEYIVVREGDKHIQSKVVSVAVNDITIQTPVDQEYSIAGATVVRGSIEMDVNGSVTPVIFKLPLTGNIPIDIQTIFVSIQHATAGDDSKFGNVTALTNGFFVRKSNSLVFNLGNYLVNGDFREFGADVEYTDKAGAGNFSTNVTFDIKKIYGVVIRLNAQQNDMFSVLVQDDLTGLVRLRVSLMGQFTTGE